MAILAAASFGSSGAMAKSLLEAGWSSGAATLARLTGAALVLSVVAVVRLRGQLRIPARSVRALVLYGLVAMAGAQLAFFSAIRTLDVGVAMLLEFLAPVMLLTWSSLRTRTLPGVPTLLGAASTLVGLAFVLELTGSASLDPVGVAWGLVGALCVCGFYILSERQEVGLPPLLMAAGGTVVGALVIAAAGLLGFLPITFVATEVSLSGASVSWLVPAAWMALVSTVTAYLSGIGAVIRLGTRQASFIGLTEVLMAVLFAWVILAELPGPSQLVGGLFIVGGIVVIRRHEQDAPPQRRRAGAIAGEVQSSEGSTGASGALAGASSTAPSGANLDP